MPAWPHLPEPGVGRRVRAVVAGCRRTDLHRERRHSLRSRSMIRLAVGASGRRWRGPASSWKARRSCEIC